MVARGGRRGADRLRSARRCGVDCPVLRRAGSRVSSPADCTLIEVAFGGFPGSSADFCTGRLHAVGRPSQTRSHVHRRVLAPLGAGLLRHRSVVLFTRWPRERPRDQGRHQADRGITAAKRCRCCAIGWCVSLNRDFLSGPLRRCRSRTGLDHSDLRVRRSRGCLTPSVNRDSARTVPRAILSALAI